MQFIVKSEGEFESTISTISSAGVYEDYIFYHILDMSAEGIGNKPEKYPCIVSIEVEDNMADNRNYFFASCKFIYKNDLLEGYEYQEKLRELTHLDNRLSNLNDLLSTSGIMSRPITEIENIQADIEVIEKQLF